MSGGPKPYCGVAVQPGWAVDRIGARSSVGQAASPRSEGRALALIAVPACQRSAGFTLIELMVALFIFAMLSAAGVMLLSGSVGAQVVVQQRLDGLSEVQRAASLMTVDFAQAVPRINRTRTGTLAPAFFAAGGNQADPAVQFVRTGRDNPDGLDRSGLQKLEYGVIDGRLIRRAYPQVDGAEAERAAVLLDGVSSVALRFRGADGVWRADWQTTDPLAMPRAVELIVVRRDAGPIRLLFLVGVDPVPRKEPPRG